LVSRTRSIVFSCVGSKSMTLPRNCGGWFVRGATSIGSTSVAVRASGSFAESPSVTWKEMDAGPK
jgi:hypothetical protein